MDRTDIMDRTDSSSIGPLGVGVACGWGQGFFVGGEKVTWLFIFGIEQP